MNEGINELKYELMNERMNEWMSEWLNDWMIEWLNDWMIEWMNEWMNEWVNQSINQWVTYCLSKPDPTMFLTYQLLAKNELIRPSVLKIPAVPPSPWPGQPHNCHNFQYFG